MRELLTKFAAEVDIRDVLALAGLVCLAFAAAVLGYLVGGHLAAVGASLAVVGAGAFYLGVFHGGRR